MAGTCAEASGPTNGRGPGHWSTILVHTSDLGCAVQCQRDWRVWHVLLVSTCRVPSIEDRFEEFGARIEGWGVRATRT